MARDIVKELVDARNRTVQTLASLAEPCPGLCGNVIRARGEYHHFPWRERHGFSDDLKLALYSPYNGVLAHRGCHDQEGIRFQHVSAVLILRRVGGVDAWWGDYGLAVAAVLYKELPKAWFTVSELWPHYLEHGLEYACPDCGPGHADLGFCWSCYRP